MLLSPLIFVISAIAVMGNSSSSHNINAVNLSSNGGYIGNKVPAEYVDYIKDMRTSFGYLDKEITNVESDMEDGDSLDSIRIKAIFYALFFGEDTPSKKITTYSFLVFTLRKQELVR